jgi:hypothetical protein
MKRHTIFLLLLAMLLFTNTVFAANWSFVGRTSRENPFNLTGATYNDYIDKNSVCKGGDILIFWHKQLFDKEDGASGETTLTKNETNLSTQKTRVLATYTYDSNGKETSHDTDPSNWIKYQKGSDFDRKISVSLRYSKESKDTGVIPTL